MLLIAQVRDNSVGYISIAYETHAKRFAALILLPCRWPLGIQVGHKRVLHGVDCHHKLWRLYIVAVRQPHWASIAYETHENK
jgi:hypothetical protein